MRLTIYLILGALLGTYSFFYIRSIMRVFNIRSSKLQIAVNYVLAVILGFLCADIRSIIALIVLHVMFFSVLLMLICTLLTLIFKKSSATESFAFIRQSGIIPILIAIILMVYGSYNMQRVSRTSYSLSTNKQITDTRVVFLSDIHYATVQNKDVLVSGIADINKLKPDIVILGGDITEEATSLNELNEVFSLLGDMTNKYGIYYVFGNHDSADYADSPYYTDSDLRYAITSNGITILEDTFTDIGNGIIIVGRADKDRLSIAQILKGVDKSKYIIVADHKPSDSEKLSGQNVDLQLSGHTHNGQIWPIGCMLRLFGTFTYGHYNVGTSDVIVSSGFAGWGFPIRTQGINEYVTVDIHHVEN